MATRREGKTKQINLRLTEEQWERLRKYAASLSKKVGFPVNAQTAARKLIEEHT